MNTQKAIKILETHNKWRRGEPTARMTDAIYLGVALDRAIEVMKRSELHGCRNDDAG